MAKSLPLKTEIENALAYLRSPSNGGQFDRAALRLEKLSQDILNPKPKTSKPKVRATRIRGGDGRSYPFKRMVEDESK